ncbi:MAG: putative toxin-antitoxin system toxin component, PIN family [Actinomycetes bacterium]
MSELLRVVIDPNVWVSGLINPYGPPALVIEAVAAGEVTAVVTRHLLDELAAVLARPKFRRWIAQADATEFVDTLGGEADLRPEPAAVPQRVRDPDDDYLVALADAAGATIVTGDHDLLEADLEPAAITPRDLLRRLGQH